MSSRLQQLQLRWISNPHLLTLACILWLAWRVGTNPMRAGYPCQRVALAQIGLYFGSVAVPSIAILHRSVWHVRRRDYVKMASIALVVVMLIGGLKLHEASRRSQLRIEGSGTIGAAWMPNVPGLGATQSPGSTQIAEFPLAPNGLNAVVSVSYDSAVDYGSVSPYDPQDNPAYGFVWETVERLELGNATSPLDGLIDAGDTVLIKPNWVDYGPAVFTQPQVVRPLIDMAIAAGATGIYVGDGAVRVSGTDYVMESAGYSDMVAELDSRHPGITVETANLNQLGNGWHWISLGGNSSFASSGYSHYDLSPGSGTLYGHQYYLTPDPQGVNPEGNTTGWYAVNDKVLEADVIINVPKMKTHQVMMSTLSMKNLVGLTLSCTYDEEEGYSQARIAHSRTDREDNYFNNDIFWRAILDMNKIVLYADQEGNLHSTPQRAYLNVIDGIQAMEKSQHHQYGGGGVPYDRNVVLASVDPVAADAVASRLMGYDFSVVPVTKNAASDTVHPIGTNDPEGIVVLGEDIDSRFDHVFEFNAAWAADAGSLAVTDFSPPAIDYMHKANNTVTAGITGALAGYVVYEADGTGHIEKMDKAGDVYSATVPDSITGYTVLAQDEHFNTAHAAPEPGDANLDGVIDGRDVIRAKKIILGLETHTDSADANGDDVVDGRDVIAIKKAILGIE